MANIMEKDKKEEYDVIAEIPNDIATTSKAEQNSNYAMSNSEIIQQTFMNETLPPQPNGDEIVFSEPSNDDCLLCCCQYAPGEASYSSNQRTNSSQHCCNGPRMIRQCFSNAFFYAIILIITFFLILLLLAELLLDLNIIVVVKDNSVALINTSNDISFSASTEQSSDQLTTILILHWINFSILSLFLIEVLVRLYAWRTAMARSLVAVWDSAAVAMAFVCNLVVTLAVGYNSPYNAISLIIIFRVVRFESIIRNATAEAKNNYRERLANVQSGQAEYQLKNQKLLQQLKEKDFEIKQLQAHLGTVDGKLDTNIRNALKPEENQTRDKYESELERAIALSKMEYENTSRGIFNPAYAPKSEYDLPSVTVHHRENSIRRTDQPSTSRGSQPYHNITHDQLHSGMEPTDDTFSLLQSNNSNNTNVQEWTVNYCFASNDDSADGKPRKFQKVFLQKSVSASASPISLSPEKGKDPTETRSYASDDGIGMDDSLPRNNSARPIKGILSTTIDEPFSDQGCISSSSICSESGYHSDDFVSGLEKKVEAIHGSGSESDQISTHTVVSGPLDTTTSSHDNIEMVRFSNEVNENHGDKEVRTKVRKAL
ncbi:uncharacterized protein LOC143465037 isoform X1 [Clavelina lepadiformis]|uniref:Hydrogen voltage-gated channel 1 n=2 Tax=Clavelina lepadiformis TaxID=159417 RepID=A0ABP0EYP9_CLALP